MGRVTGAESRLWGSIVGFGQYHYRYVSGREGDAPAAGFAVRRAALTVYLPDGVGAHADLLPRLGHHTTGVGCLYVKALADLDLDMLEAIVARSYATVTAGTYPHRARIVRPGAVQRLPGHLHQRGPAGDVGVASAPTLRPKASEAEGESCPACCSGPPPNGG